MSSYPFGNTANAAGAIRSTAGNLLWPIWQSVGHDAAIFQEEGPRGDYWIFIAPGKVGMIPNSDTPVAYNGAPTTVIPATNAARSFVSRTLNTAIQMWRTDARELEELIANHLMLGGTEDEDRITAPSDIARRASHLETLHDGVVTCLVLMVGKRHEYQDTPS